MVVLITNHDLSDRWVVERFLRHFTAVLKTELVATVDLFAAWSWCHVAEPCIVAPAAGEAVCVGAFYAGVGLGAADNDALDAERTEQRK